MKLSNAQKRVVYLLAQGERLYEGSVRFPTYAALWRGGIVTLKKKSDMYQITLTKSGERYAKEQGYYE